MSLSVSALTTTKCKLLQCMHYVKSCKFLSLMLFQAVPEVNAASCCGNNLTWHVGLMVF